MMKGLRFFFYHIKRNPLSVIGLVLVITFAIIAIFAPLISPTPEGQFDAYMIPRDGYASTPEPPSEEHIFGTTQGQYDIFYGVIWGTRTAFQVGFIVMGVVLIIGIFLGSIAGYFGGIVDEIIMRITDIFLAFPPLILAMAVTIALGASIESVMIAIIVVTWPSYARVIRGDILAVREEDYIEASRSVGSSHLRVIIRHVLPNSIYPIFIMASLDIGAVVLTAAALSFLGLGVPTGYADWGQMINFARDYIIGTPNNAFAYWHAVMIPGLFIFFFVMGWNLLGDSLRDILDPRLARR